LKFHFEVKITFSDFREAMTLFSSASLPGRSLVRSLVAEEKVSGLPAAA